MGPLQLIEYFMMLMVRKVNWVRVPSMWSQRASRSWAAAVLAVSEVFYNRICFYKMHVLYYNMMKYFV